jgi:hypothetical protein
MNAEAVAQRLGFGDIAEEILAEEEELDFLGEILCSVGWQGSVSSHDWHVRARA